MRIRSLLPPTSFQSVVSGQWYIVTTDPKLGWVEVDRNYSWAELNSMWDRVTYKTTEVKPTSEKKTYKVAGSKGNSYKVINDGGTWTCNCPAASFRRGDCKHIKEIKLLKTK
jgi:hypothetical protein